MFTLLRFPLALGVLTLLSPDLDQVRIEHRTGLAYEMRMTRTMSMRLGEASMHVGGQEFPADMVKGSVPDRDDVETVVLRNVVRKAEEGRPVQVVREFVELGMQRTVAEETTQHTGALEGMQLVLERGADGDVEARLEEGAEQTVDEAYLAGHLLEHGIHRLLPEESVEPGASWTPDADAVRALLLSPGPQYYEKKSTAELPSLLEEAAEFTAEMTLRERVKLDGVECYRLELGVQLQAEIGKLPKEFSSGDQSEEGSLRVESEHRGELWIAVQTRFPVKLEIESEWTFDVLMNVEQDGMAIQIKMELTANNASSREWEILE
jgi:hypothetical protein